MESISREALSPDHSFMCHLVIHLFSQNLLVASVYCAGQGCGWPGAHMGLGAADGLRGCSGQGFDLRLLGAIWRMCWQQAKAQVGNLSGGKNMCAGTRYGLAWSGQAW